ncbi:MAG: knotted carbamoyltransferase YgeW [Bacteroidetes bacterium GWC2_33_15]|nr:MAG: knotted carbamoyltransferase YgeW [Bacteroidetes bacterium GWA2_33_15]OFX48607.1 MAG: knotted carbamoyltransferase YgeW [Bacteroidetes bacterium GWC2_33_15]OFX64581.1 MAG: knotted carbamoyltransferase YgeW [Bacteroidetes bacterium GWB2_32_14]OFX68001.1 MAG: knotted carbamoyltransferase YgeW [Bacteroidetes bacterium GWD2_33_33]HAN18236.1 knotted carbamoyltransferase YgeW [Bacteroidales bacterium]
MSLHDKIQKLSALKTNLYKKDFLLTWEKSQEDLKAVLDVAEILKEMRDNNISPRVFDSGLAISNFRDNSTRTRFSFASASNLLGLAVQDLDEQKSQIAHGETVRETANMISFLSDFIGIRDDMFLGEGNKYMREVGEALDEGFAKGVLPSRPGIVNLQCDMDHPTQSMADLMHLQNQFGSLENLKGKKIVMSWAYSPSYGKPLSVPQGIIALMSRYGMNIELAYPEGYGLIPEIVEIAKNNAKQSGGSLNVSHSMEDAMKDADIVYPKSWAPFHIMQQRTKLLQAADKEGLKALEQTCLTNNAKFKNWEYNDAKKKLTKNQDALYMHCLPADISGVSCKEGEVNGNVFEQYRIRTYLEAGFKPYIIAAMMFTTKFEKPSEVLQNILKRNNKRVGL